MKSCLQSNAATFLSIFLVVTVWQYCIIRFACESDAISNLILEHSDNVKASVEDLLIKIDEVTKLKKEEEHTEVQIHSERILPFWDYTRLSNLNNFHFTIFNKVCKSESVLLLIFVNSEPGHTKQRETIRKTWGNKEYRNKIRIIFSLGAVQSRKQQENIETENEAHKDILQGNFIDSYKNLTYKHIMNLKYITYYCQDTVFAMKINDDIFVNTPALIALLESTKKSCNPENYLLCVHKDNFLVPRDNSKWSVSFEEYPSKNYPRFCFGSFPVIYTYDVVYSIYQEAQKGDFFYVEDAYMTGIIAERLTLKHRQALNFTLSEEESKVVLESGWEKGRRDFIFGSHSMTDDLTSKLWNIVQYSDNNFKFEIEC